MENPVRAHAALLALLPVMATACDDIAEPRIASTLEAVSPVEVTGVVGTGVSPTPAVRVTSEWP
jgi:hypothetical protein